MTKNEIDESWDLHNPNETDKIYLIDQLKKALKYAELNMFFGGGE